MAPAPSAIVRSILPRRDTVLTSNVITQWSSPGDILSLLLIIGGDVIQCSIAQLAGDPILPTPVTFSFGWVAYSFMMLMASIGDNRLMPSAPDLECSVINADSGYSRSNQSWILSRILRDFEYHWTPPETAQAVRQLLADENGKIHDKRGLCITVCDAIGEPKIPHRDLLWWSGYVVTVIQLGIAAIPWALWGNWLIFVIAAAGTTLAYLTGSHPQWRTERWSCREKSKKTICLLRGNGAQHVLVIRGCGTGLDLEDLAGATGCSASESRHALVFSSALMVLWVCLLITVSGMKENTWFLLAIGTLGMLHNLVLAGSPRRPEVFGMPLEFNTVIFHPKVMPALQGAEMKFHGLGRSLRDVFFPAGLRPEELGWWEAAEERHKREKDAEKKAKDAEKKAAKEAGEAAMAAGQEEVREMAKQAGTSKKADLRKSDTPGLRQDVLPQQIARHTDAKMEPISIEKDALGVPIQIG
jgi:hypothetical protein